MNADRESSGAPNGGPFELTGGSLCVNFANTVDSRPTSAPRELLGSYRDLLGWSLQAGALAEEDAGRLRVRAGRAPARPTRVLGRARRLREAIFAPFRAVAAGGELPADRWPNSTSIWRRRWRTCD